MLTSTSSNKCNNQDIFHGEFSEINLMWLMLVYFSINLVKDKRSLTEGGVLSCFLFFAYSDRFLLINEFSQWPKIPLTYFFRDSCDPCDTLNNHKY